MSKGSPVAIFSCLCSPISLPTPPSPYTNAYRFVRSTIDIAGYSIEETVALYAALNKFATASNQVSHPSIRYISLCWWLFGSSVSCLLDRETYIYIHA